MISYLEFFDIGVKRNAKEDAILRDKDQLYLEFFDIRVESNAE
jgi:hypothetical protein